MKKLTFLIFLFFAIIIANAQPTGEIQKLLQVGDASNDQLGYSVSIDGNFAVVGSPFEDINGSNSGAAYVYYYNGTDWIQYAKLTASDEAADDNFGYSVGISGNYIIVGAYLDDSPLTDAGSAYIFRYSAGNWSQMTKLVPSSSYAQDRFGFSVAIDGDYAIIGATYDDNQGQNSGTAFIYYNNAGTWQEQTILTPSDGEMNKYFGTAVDISGNYAIVGQMHKGTNNQGAAYIFKNNAGTWSQLNKITASDAAANDYFGVSVSISNNYAIVGSYMCDAAATNDGAAYFFKNNSDNWTQYSKFVPSDAINYSQLGISVNISGDYAVIGANRDNHILSSNGSAYVLSNNAGTWEQEKKLEPSDPVAGKYFGTSVGISGNNVVSGAIRDNTYGNMAGAAYFYNKDKGGSLNWGETNKLLPTTGKKNDKFGTSVAVSGSNALVGIPGDNQNGSSSGSVNFYHYNGTNWDLINNLTSSDNATNNFFGSSVSVSGNFAIVGAYANLSKGAAYIFQYSAGAWSQYAKLTASDGAASDFFGSSVYIDGNYAIVGAYGDDDLGSGSGSAYIFQNISGTWTQVAKIKASDGVATDYFGYSVAISGNYAILGAYGDDDAGSSSGSAYIFFNNAGTWEQNAKIHASDAAMLDNFGYSVCISGDYAIVGAYGNDDAGSSSGSAYIFKNNAGTWSQQSKLTASDAAANDYFGGEVSISGDFALVGAYLDANPTLNAGSAYLFQNNSGTWSQMSKFVSSDNLANGRFGHSVCIDGNNAIIGADNSNVNGSQSGEAYIFGQIMPVITSQPTDIASACVNQNSSFAVSGNGITDYQWQVSTNSGSSWADLSEAPPYSNTQTSTLTVDVQSTMDNYLFRCKCSNVIGSVTSNSAKINIETEKPVITSTIADKTVSANSSCQASLADYTGELTATDNCNANLTITQNPVAGTSIAGTTNTITLRATDDAGNYTETSFNVAVVDNTNPVITSTNTDKNVSGNSSCQANLPDYTTELTATDNCDASLTITQNPLAGTLITGTTNGVTLRATDDAGNYAETSFNVAVVDNTNPVITSTHTDKTLAANSSCQANLPDYTSDVVATDDCDANLTITQNPVAGTLITGSTNSVTLRATDDAGNFDEVSFNVAVIDNTNPVITSTHADKTISANSSCQANLPDYTSDVVATDDCDANLTITQNPLAGTIITGTTNAVTLRATDDAGNYAETTFNVAVVDNTNPVIPITPTTQHVSADNNCFGILDDYTSLISPSDNCDANLTITQTPAAGTTVSSHSNTITLKATDDAGNFAQVSFQVIIDDNTKPEITSTLSDQIVNNESNCQATLPNYASSVTAIDNCDSYLTITQSPAAGTLITGSINTVTITVTDDAYNQTQASFNVAVTDNTNPVITSSHSDTTVSANSSCQANLPDYTSDVIATDNCDANLTITQNPVAGTSIAGTTNTVTLRATDDAGNYAEVSFNVAVVDNTNPEFTCVDNQSKNLQEGQTTYTVSGTEFDPTGMADNCGIANVINDFNNTATLANAEFPIGQTTVTWTITDNAGNYTDCSFDITVNAYGTAIKETSDDYFKIFPNPTNNFVVIQLKDKVENFKLDIIDQSGKIISSESNIKSRTRIDFSNFSKGIYFLKISNKKEVYFTKLILY